MRTIELFCGTKSFSKVAESLGHQTFTLDNDSQFDATITEDILTWTPPAELINANVLWASPPCQGFSVAVIGRNWNHDKTPKTPSAELAMSIAVRTLEVIEILKPKYYFIENPRGMLRMMPFMQGMRRVTVTYCQYGDTRQKPTDIWTNVPESVWKPRPLCRPGASCHISAPRGSRTGTQGLKNAKERSRIPEDIFKEIFSVI